MSNLDNTPPIGGYPVPGTPQIYTGVTPPPPPVTPPPPPPYVPPDFSPPPYVPPDFSPPPYVPPTFFNPPVFFDPPSFFSPPNFLAAPTFSAPTSTIGGFTFTINNYDGVESYTATTTAGSVSISGTTVTVTGLTPSQSATVTINDSRQYYQGNSAQITGTALALLAAPTFSAVTSTAGGFTFTITNYDGVESYSLTTTAGSVSRSGTTVTVTGLSSNQSATVTVNDSRSYYQGNSSQITGTSLNLTLVKPQFSTPIANTTGFTSSVTNADGIETFTVTTTAGSVSISAYTGAINVTGLTYSQSATVTVTASRGGYNSSSSSFTGTALPMPTLPNPTIGSITPTAGGFTALVTNSDGVETYTVSTTAGFVTIGQYSGSINVTGLNNGQSATVTITASKTNYQSSSTSFTGTSQQALVNPTFSAAIPGDNSFSFSVSNYDSTNTYTASASSGSVSVSPYAGSYIVTGLSDGQSSTVTITASKSGYVSSSSQITGTSNFAGLSPSASLNSYTSNSLSGTISNYDPSYTWSISSTSGSASLGSNSGSSMPFTVTGLSPASSTVITITAQKNGYKKGTYSLTGYTSITKPTIVLGNNLSDGFTFYVSNYDSSVIYTANTNNGTITQIGASGYYQFGYKVSGLSGGQSATVSVSGTKSNGAYGYYPLATSDSLTSYATLIPTFGTFSSTDSGFSGTVSNFNSNYTWTATVNNGGVITPTNLSSNSFVVSNLTAPSSADVTINVYSGSTLLGTATKTGYTNLPKPQFSSPQQTPDGRKVSVNITNYDSKQTYTVTTNVGTATFGTPSGSIYPIQVSNIQQTGTLVITVSVSETNYGSNSATLSYPDIVTSIKININGSWVSMNTVYINNNGSWLPAKSIYINNNGSWTQVY